MSASERPFLSFWHTIETTMELKEKLRLRKKTIGTWITVPHRFFVEAAANAGFDWICVDLEHTTIDLDQLGNLLAVARARGIGALVRVSSLDSTLIKRVMDAGSTGIIVPMVNTPAQAKEAYESMQYPPTGKRGVGLSTAQGFGAHFQQYTTWLKENAVLIVQIEHHEAIKNLEEILSQAGVDGFFVGPYDLSASLGKPGDFENPRFLSAMSEIEKIQSKSTKARGIHVVEPDVLQVQKAITNGYDFIAYSFEMKIIEQDYRKMLAHVSPSLK